MNETYIQQVLDIEKKAQAIYEDAQREAQHISVQAEQEAQAHIENSRVESEVEARKLIENARAQDEITRILAQADENIQQEKALSIRHFDQAVGFILKQVAGVR
jgi:F0F1-type ATP synthase membrane subunit b/b'